MKEKLINFLNQKNIYDQFMINVKNEATATEMRNYWEFVNDHLNPEDIINTSFLFENTPEGEGFWKEIEEKWQKYLKS